MFLRPQVTNYVFYVAHYYVKKIARAPGRGHKNISLLSWGGGGSKQNRSKESFGAPYRSHTPLLSPHFTYSVIRSYIFQSFAGHGGTLPLLNPGTQYIPTGTPGLIPTTTGGGGSGGGSHSGDSSDMNEQDPGSVVEGGSNSDSLKYKVVTQLSCLRQIMARLLREKFQIGEFIITYHLF